jgi:hypothetical protein
VFEAGEGGHRLLRARAHGAAAAARLRDWIG